jgi:hypothetical protein
LTSVAARDLVSQDRSAWGFEVERSVQGKMASANPMQPLSAIWHGVSQAGECKFDNVNILEQAPHILVGKMAT